MHIVLMEPLGISKELLESYVQPLREAGHTFTAYPKTDDTAQLIRQAEPADILMLANMPLRGEVIAACPHLQFIDIAFTGVDHVDLKAAKQRGIRVSNAAGYATEAVAELALGTMLSLLRSVPEAQQRCRAGGTRQGLSSRELYGKTVGIVGAGAIGLRLMQLLSGFSCKLLAYSRQPREEVKRYAEYLPLDELLAKSDIVSLHCPLTAETRGLIDRRRLALMKPGALLINTARGPVVDSAALAEALEGRLGGAGIDVFESEPPIPAGHPLLHSRNTLVTPHIAFASEESMRARADIVFDNLWQWLGGKQANAVL